MNSKGTRTTWAALAMAAFGVAASPASAYSYWTCNGEKRTWESSTVTYKPLEISFPSGSSERASVMRMRSAWIAYSPGTNFSPVFSFTNDDQWESGDGINDIAFTDDYDFGGAVGVTIIRFDACIWPFWDGDLHETDILFDPDFAWDLATHPSPSTADFSLTLAGVHELGHSLALDHEDRWLATMNSVLPAGGPFGLYNDPDPHADDVEGNRFLYGESAAENDLAASIYLRTSAGNSGFVRPPPSAARGTSVALPFTVANRGTSSLSNIRVDLYLSTNRVIDTNDVYLGSISYGIASGMDRTYTATRTIPASLTPGLYYFGFIVDPNSAVLETDEGNNMISYFRPINVY